jgi:hypothetical protein
MYVRMELVYTSSYIPMLLYFVVQIALASAIGGSIFAPLFYPLIVAFWGFCFQHSLSFWWYKLVQAHLVFYVLILEPPMSPQNPSSFH